MSLDTIKRTIPKAESSKSKKFFGNFREELKKTLISLEISLGEELTKHFTIDSIIRGNADIKIRVSDDHIGSEKIMNIIFRYNHDDEKYGNIYIEISIYQVSEKTKTHFLGKYLVTDQKGITKNVIKDSITAIKSL